MEVDRAVPGGLLFTDVHTAAVVSRAHRQRQTASHLRAYLHRVTSECASEHELLRRVEQDGRVSMDAPFGGLASETRVCLQVAWDWKTRASQYAQSAAERFVKEATQMNRPTTPPPALSQPQMEPAPAQVQVQSPMITAAHRPPSVADASPAPSAALPSLRPSPRATFLSPSSAARPPTVAGAPARSLTCVDAEAQTDEAVLPAAAAEPAPSLPAASPCRQCLSLEQELSTYKRRALAAERLLERMALADEEVARARARLFARQPSSTPSSAADELDEEESAAERKTMAAMPAMPTRNNNPAADMSMSDVDIALECTDRELQLISEFEHIGIVSDESSPPSDVDAETHLRHASASPEEEKKMHALNLAMGVISDPE